MESYKDNYFDEFFLDNQPVFSRKPVYVLDHIDVSAAYETDISVLLYLDNGNYAVVKMYGCSCYTDCEVYENTSIQAVTNDSRDTYGSSEKLYKKAMERGFRH